MGLDTTHGCWNGPYSSFGRFRKALASELGINLDECIGFGGDKVDLDKLEHDIQPLLNHSDCDGKLTPEEALRVANGLNEIYLKLPQHPDYDDLKEKILQFRNGCIAAVKAKEDILFA